MQWLKDTFIILALKKKKSFLPWSWKEAEVHVFLKNYSDSPCHFGSSFTILRSLSRLFGPLPFSPSWSISSSACSSRMSYTGGLSGMGYQEKITYKVKTRFYGFWRIPSSYKKIIFIDVQYLYSLLY